ncbi:MAG: hypothetical protein AAGE59_12610 [Cyanobacteria bacterium P01_F01_bin.86]
MHSAGILLQTSRACPPTTSCNWKERCLWSWRGLLGGVLGALLLSVSTQASPLELSETVPVFLEKEVTNGYAVEDGIYFYGEASQPDEIGKGYMVFEAQDNQVVGAMFMPHSSFDCFVGQVDNRNLSLQITNSYTQETYEYAIALIVDESIATLNSAPIPFHLDGLTDLGAARDSELSMLSTCQTDLGSTTLLRMI